MTRKKPKPRYRPGSRKGVGGKPRDPSGVSKPLYLRVSPAERALLALFTDLID